jgi:hypothetical protein
MVFEAACLPGHVTYQPLTIHHIATHHIIE